MKWLAFSVALFLVVLSAEASLLSFLRSPRYDGVQRVHHLQADNFKIVLSAAEIAVVIFTEPGTTPVGKCQCPSELDIFAETSAQVLQKKGIIVCKASADLYASLQLPELAMTQVNAGDVYIYKKGRGQAYYGRRSATALLNFLHKINGTQINTITGKIDKIAFDAVQQAKVVGFFMPGTADYAAFEEAAANLSPSVLFYTTFDRVVAKHLKLDTVGQIYFIKPFEKTAVICPQNPATAADIEAFVKGTKGAVFTKITEHSMYDPQLLIPNKTLVLAIAEQSSALGGYLYRLITKLVQNNTNSTEFEVLNILWIEPQLFPAIYLGMNEMEAVLGIPNKLPAVGAINVTTLQNAWFDTTLLNATADKTADAENLRILQDWLTGVINSTVIPIKTGLQSFVQQPSSQVLTEGSNAILECIIANPVGDCLWLRNGRNIGFNLARYPQYSWHGDTTVGDCTLLITGVQKYRDDGDWVCQVTGDQDNPTLTSAPANVIISVAPTSAKTEL